MSSEIIKVLDNICEKFGVAIDWTSKNVTPYITEVLNKYAKYKIVSNILWIVFLSIFCCSCFCVLKSIYKAYKTNKKDSIWLYYGGELNGFALTAIIIGATIALISLSFIVASTYSIVEWSIIPEFKFIEMLGYYLKS